MNTHVVFVQQRAESGSAVTRGDERAAARIAWIGNPAKEEHGPQFDFITPSEEHAMELRLADQRIITLLIYLNEDMDARQFLSADLTCGAFL